MIWKKDLIEEYQFETPIWGFSAHPLVQGDTLFCLVGGEGSVAVAFDTPVVCLMGPTSLAKTNLNLERVRVLSADVGCRPCYHRVCPIDHRCMTRLTPERALAAAERVLDGRPQDPDAPVAPGGELLG